MGTAPPVIVPRPAPSVISRIGAPAAPTHVTTPLPGPIGPASTVPGPTARGFGTIDYTDNNAGAALDLPASQWVRIIRNLTPSPANFNLPCGPWTGFAFWDNGTSTLRARAIGDLYLFKFTFSVVPAQREGGLRFAVRPGDNPQFEFGPEPIVLTADAGQSQTGSETFSQQVRTRFATAGAQLYIMSTTGAALTQFSPEVSPISYAQP